MSQGAGGEIVIVYFSLDDGRVCEAHIAGRQWSHVPNPDTLQHRTWWLDHTKTPWVWNTDLTPDETAYSYQRAVERFGREVPWNGGSVADITEAVMGRGGKIGPGYYPADILGAIYDEILADNETAPAMLSEPIQPAPEPEPVE
jgi:hypothetical protein